MAKKRKKSKRPAAGQPNASSRTPERSGGASPSGISRSDAASPAPRESTVSPPNLLDHEGIVVGLGASAGGLDALRQFFLGMPPDSGLAFVVVTHQHVGHVSLLPQLLAKETAMPVVEATDGMAVQANRVYVAPPGARLTLSQGKLRRLPTPESQSPRSPRSPIDDFLRSLADDRQHRAIGVVLSGSGSDGTEGVRAIKAESGMVMAQDPKSAQYASMPSSAIATGLVDAVLPADEMGKRLVAFTQAPDWDAVRSRPGSDPLAEEALQGVLVLLRARTGHDFSDYKPKTIRRRIERRMQLHQIADCEQYVQYLREHSAEVELLFRELLISVTSFFRDPEAWEALRQALEKAIRSNPENDRFRVWVPGCATGEEAYSVAIVLRELIDRCQRRLDVQIFGTDLDAHAIEVARAGEYPSGITTDLSPERLKRSFIREGDGYRIRKDIREMVVFATQNVIADPPFTRLDLIACRNLLIYLKSELQKRLLPVFHYALKPNGILFLGPSETIGAYEDLFEPLEKRWKIFRRQESARLVQSVPEFPPQSATGGQDRDQARRPPRFDKEGSISARVGEILLAKYAPAALLVDEQGEIVYIHGRTGLYLEPTQGRPRTNVLEMAREGLHAALAAAIRRCLTTGADVSQDRIRVTTEENQHSVELHVSQLTSPESLRGLLLVTLRPSPSPAQPVQPEPESASARAAEGELGEGDQFPRLEALQRELQSTKRSHQTALEELETSNEELKSTNEELQSTNEELQSINEELETSKEELQSLNEELTTVNAELQSKVDELSQSNDDMQNLLNSTDIATVFLDDDLNIKRFTDQAQQLVRLRASDIGRPISELASNLEGTDLPTVCQQVLKTLAYREDEVRTKDGKWYLMRVLPYRTCENVIDGLVLTFVDINRLKLAEQKSAQAETRLATALEIMTRLHELSAQTTQQNRPPESVFNDVLEAAMEIAGTNRGAIQLFDPDTSKLKILAQRGFPQPWIDFWDQRQDHGACGEALRLGEPVIVEHVGESAIFSDEATSAVQREAGVQAVVSIPLSTYSEQPLGVISTHFDHPHRPDERTLRVLDLLALHAADIIQRAGFDPDAGKQFPDTDPKN